MKMTFVSALHDAPGGRIVDAVVFDAIAVPDQPSFHCLEFELLRV